MTQQNSKTLLSEAPRSRASYTEREKSPLTVADVRLKCYGVDYFVEVAFDGCACTLTAEEARALSVHLWSYASEAESKSFWEKWREQKKADLKEKADKAKQKGKKKKIVP